MSLEAPRVSLCMSGVQMEMIIVCISHLKRWRHYVEVGRHYTCHLFFMKDCSIDSLICSG